MTEPLKALPDWHHRLDTVVRDRLTKPFKWGEQDCALFAADCVQAVTGDDLAATLRGTYSTALAAARILESWGGLEALATAKLGEPHDTQWNAVPGDIGLVQSANGPCLALCAGTHWLAPGERGLQPLARADALKAWKVVG